jgi:hypothetical protein
VSKNYHPICGPDAWQEHVDPCWVGSAQTQMPPGLNDDRVEVLQLFLFGSFYLIELALRPTE